MNCSKCGSELNNKITVKVSGTRGTGSTHVAMMIAQYLNMWGYKIKNSTPIAGVVEAPFNHDKSLASSIEITVIND